MATTLFLTISVPTGDGGQVYYSMNIAANTVARIWNGVQLDFYRALGIPEFTNQAPQVLDGYRDISVAPMPDSAGGEGVGDDAHS